nr:DUF2786 domain-containing protein [Micromonospora sp. DSM 115978]
METDALLSRIRKLLAMAEAEGLGDAARETYNAKAAALIAQYGVDRALLEASQPGAFAAADLDLVVDPPYARDKAQLLAAVAIPLGCRLVHRTRRLDGNTVHSGHLFGMPADLERVQLLFTSLLVQQALGLAVAIPPHYEDARAFRRSWIAGFAAAVHDRLVAAERAAKQRAQAGRSAGPSVDLVLADRSAQVEAHVVSVYPSLRSMRSRQLSGSGRGAGYHAGERADLGFGGRVGKVAENRAIGA